MNRYSFVLAVALLGLSACTSQAPSEQPHAVDQYAADDALTAKTLEACRASSEAERRELEKKPACRNAWAAEHARNTQEMDQATSRTNAWMQAEIAKSRAARAAAEKKEKPE